MLRQSQKPYKGMGMNGLVASWYNKTTGKNLSPFREQAHALLGQLRSGASPGSKILEVAPGPGFLAIELAKLGNFKITGIDISESFVEIARQNAKRASVDVEFRHGNASAMPFTDNHFDLIVCRAAFKNFSDPGGALNEMHRVLKPGGRAIIIDLRKDASPEEISDAVAKMDVNPLNSFLIKQTFRLMLLRRAYTQTDFERMAQQSHFGQGTIKAQTIGFEVTLTK